MKIIKGFLKLYLKSQDKLVKTLIHLKLFQRAAIVKINVHMPRLVVLPQQYVHVPPPR